jgi:hypothetical protein
MPAFIAMLVGALRYAAGNIAGQVLVGLGIGVLTYQGVDISLEYLKGQALANLAGLPAELLGLLSFMKVGVFINIVSSAMVARLTMTGVRNQAGKIVNKRFSKV